MTGRVNGDRATPEALAAAAAAAGYAPSVHNTQPWRWRVLPERLELHAERKRQLTVSDPDAHLLLLSCGTALHHAQLALAAEGWRCTVERFPDPTDADLLAYLTATQRRDVDAGAMRLIQTMQVRHTDRRPLSDAELGHDVVDSVRAAAAEHGARLQVLSGAQIYELASAAARAGDVESADERVREELAYWTHRGGSDGTGLPPHVLAAGEAQTTVPNRDFGGPGTLPMGPGHDRAAVYALLYGDEDEPESWLRAGEALSAAWLTATQLGASVLPLSAAVEVATTREALRRLLSGLGYPYLVLRLGVPDPAHAGPAHPPRLPADQVVDTSAVRDAGPPGD